MAVQTLTNFAQSTLAADLTAGATTEMVLADVSSFPAAGYVTVFRDDTPVTDAANPSTSLQREVIHYSGRDLGQNKLTGLTRAQQGTTATAFSISGSTTYRVWRGYTAQDQQDIKDEFTSQDARITVLESDVVVRKSTGGNDTAAIQALIDAIAAAGGGTVRFAAGTHKHTGLSLKAAVTLQGVNQEATILDYTPSSGDGIVAVANPDKASVRDMRLRSAGNSPGWALAFPDAVARDCVIRDVSFSNHHKGLYLSPDNLNCHVQNTRFNGPGKTVAGSTAMELGTAAVGGNGVTIDGCYISSYELGIDTHVSVLYVPRCLLEACTYGIRTHAGTTKIDIPWLGSAISANTYDIDVQGNGILIVGYGSSNYAIRFIDDSARNRTVIVPERLDRVPSGSGEIEGFGVGRTAVRNYGARNVLSMGRDDRITFRDDPAAKGLDTGPSILSGAGAPTDVVAEGSLYLRTDPADQHTVLYVYWDGGWYPVGLASS